MAHPSRHDHQFHPFPRLGDGGDGFPFSQQRRGEQNIRGGIVSGSEGPGVSERVKMATEISRLTTAQCQGCKACLLLNPLEEQ